MTTASLSPTASRSSRASSASSSSSPRFDAHAKQETTIEPPPLPLSRPLPPSYDDDDSGYYDHEAAGMALALSPPSSTSSTSSLLSAHALLDEQEEQEQQQQQRGMAHAHRVMFGRDVIQVPLKLAANEYVNLVLSQREFDVMAIHLPQYDEMPPEELLEQITRLVKESETRRRNRLGSSSSEQASGAPSDSLAAFQGRVLELEYERKRLHTKLKAARALQASLTDENTTLRVHLQEAEQATVDYEQLCLQNELLRDQTLQSASDVAKLKRLAYHAQDQLHELSDELRVLRTQVADDRDETLLTTQDAMAALVDDVTQREQVLQQSYLAEKHEREAMAEKYYELSGRIRVFCRLRPGNEAVDDAKTAALLMPRPNSILVAKAGKEFAFDQVFGPQSSQADVYAQLEPLIVSFADGYNTCIMAYGQTGSGKTHTMVGNDHGSLEHRGNGLTVNANAGMIPRALQQVFAMVEKRQLTYVDVLRVSMVEIYNDQILDLLSEASGGGKNAAIKNETDITARDVTCYAQVAAALRDGNANRNIAATSMNLESSRSHALLFLHLESQHRDSREVRTSTLCLVDLAGSERISRSQVEGERLRETQHINKSLAALGDVVYALQHKAKHTPYRNSKLTYMLRDMLSGQAKTLLMLQLSPDGADVEETTCSLQFGARVSQVQMGAVRPSVETGALFKLQEENRALEAKVVASETKLADWQRQCQHQEDELHEAQSSKEALERQLWLLGGRRRPDDASSEQEREDAPPSPPRPLSPTLSAKSTRSVSSNTSARSARSVRSTRSTQSTQSTASSAQRPNARRTQMSSSRVGASTSTARPSAAASGPVSAPSTTASRMRRPDSMLDREARRKSLSATGADRILDRETRRKSLSTLQARSSSSLAAPRTLRTHKEAPAALSSRTPLHTPTSQSRRAGSSTAPAPNGTTRSQGASASRLSRPRGAVAPTTSPPRSSSSSSSSGSNSTRTPLRRAASNPSGTTATRTARAAPKSGGDLRRSTLSSSRNSASSGPAASTRQAATTLSPNAHSGFGWK